jgi:hypothetical protein
MKALYKQLKMQYIINPRSALYLQQRGGGGEDGQKQASPPKLRLGDGIEFARVNTGSFMRGE